MKKEETRDIDFDRDYESICQVTVDSGKSGPDSGTFPGGRAESITVGKSRRNEKSGKGASEGRQAGGRNMGKEGHSLNHNGDADVGYERRKRSRGRNGGAEKAVSSRKAMASQTENRGGASGPQSKTRKGGSKGAPVLALILAFVLGGAGGLGGGYYLWGWERPYTVDLKAVEIPQWVTQDLIRKNIFSRPDVSRKRIDNIVVHYVANPGSTAEKNRDYFDSLADQDPQAAGASASSHFIVGLEGEVIQCIPITEIAYANAPKNDSTVAIEVCHPDETGKFNDATYDSLVKLTAWLCGELELAPRDVIRHYDVNGKECPKYFVDHEDAWKQFIKDVKAAMD